MEKVFPTFVFFKLRTTVELVSYSKDLEQRPEWRQKKSLTKCIYLEKGGKGMEKVFPTFIAKCAIDWKPENILTDYKAFPI